MQVRTLRITSARLCLNYNHCQVGHKHTGQSHGLILRCFSSTAIRSKSRHFQSHQISSNHRWPRGSDLLHFPTCHAPQTHFLPPQDPHFCRLGETPNTPVQKAEKSLKNEFLTNQIAQMMKKTESGWTAWSHENLASRETIQRRTHRSQPHSLISSSDGKG